MTRSCNLFCRAGTRCYLPTYPFLDNIGSEDYNMKLGQKRADAVKDYLVARGISADRLSTRSFGESMPIADNKTADGRAINRRVEFKVLN